MGDGKRCRRRGSRSGGRRTWASTLSPKGGDFVTDSASVSRPRLGSNLFAESPLICILDLRSMSGRVHAWSKLCARHHERSYPIHCCEAAMFGLGSQQLPHHVTRQTSTFKVHLAHGHLRPSAHLRPTTTSLNTQHAASFAHQPRPPAQARLGTHSHSLHLLSFLIQMRNVLRRGQVHVPALRGAHLLPRMLEGAQGEAGVQRCTRPCRICPAGKVLAGDVGRGLCVARGYAAARGRVWRGDRRRRGRAPRGQH